MPRADVLGVENVLEVVTDIFAIEGVHVTRRKEYKFLCPVHEDHSPSAEVNLVTGLWSCYSCGASGDLIDLGKRTIGGSRKKIKDLVTTSDPNTICAAVQRRTRALVERHSHTASRSSQNGVEVPPVGSYDDGPFDYLYGRGFTDETIEQWGVEYVRNSMLRREDGSTFTIEHCIAIPIFSEKGSLVAWCYRATPQSPRWLREVRYLYTPGVSEALSKQWLGLHLWTDRDEIVVAEGALDAMWISQCGFPAVAIGGSANSVKEVTKIRKLLRFKTVVIFTDRDEAGVTVAYSLGQSLQDRGVRVRVCRFASWMTNAQGKQAKDAQELPPLDVELVHARSIPYLSWKHALTV